MPRKPDLKKKERYNDPFPTRLRELMRDNDPPVTQEQLLEVLKLKNRQSVTGYINGETLPSSEKLVAIADYFSVSCDYLLGKSNNKTNDIELDAAASYTGLTTEAVTILRFIASSENRLKYLNILIENFAIQITGSMMEIERSTNAAKPVLLDISNTPAKLQEIKSAHAQLWSHLGYFSEISRQFINKSFGSYSVLENLNQAYDDIVMSGEISFEDWEGVQNGQHIETAEN